VENLTSPKPLGENSVNSRLEGKYQIFEVLAKFRMKMNEILTKSCIFGPLRIDYQRAGWFGMEAAHRLEMEPVCPSVLVDGFNLSEPQN
jgi:hypothetical protein